MIMEKGSPSIFVVGLGIGIIQQRLAEEKAYLEHLDLERVHRGDPSFNKTIEERIIWGELLELELQEVDEQIERICEKSGPVSTRQTEMRKNKLRRCQDFCVNGFRLVNVFRLHWLHLSGG
jgi:hypothetical protein